ncbi:CRISPR-associated helicase/endonuclease Cas3 [Sulfobacillus thermosulfidooxidans]|uniref:CRISPR-associated helicase/endonuclease Cas3 n=1 Tax=Sulfobacillus thermosulfidooxidans TaxID=28034 RepID=UPI0002E8C668|nr:CRISPR-associated helicase/endonuclease Cas3 [Sulfobacillus thermosulfidooxidans]
MSRNEGEKCWAKSILRENISVSHLSLAAHCLDVALVFRYLVDLDSIRRALQKMFGTDLSDVLCDRLAVLAGLHDIGKANVGFQQRLRGKGPRAGHIHELAPLLDSEIAASELQESLVHVLSPLLEWFANEESAYSYLMVTFSHHGSPLFFQGGMSGTFLLARDQWWRPSDHYDPFWEISTVVSWLQQAFPRAFDSHAAPIPDSAPFEHRVAGLVTLADWIGSHSEWFPLKRVEFAERYKEDRANIPAILRTIGLDVSRLRPLLTLSTFSERFGMDPRPMQAVCESLSPQDPDNALLIWEDDTGSGKTEAALDWFYQLFSAGKVDSLYFALPTRVAAAALYKRIRKLINHWFPPDSERPVTVLAVPGYPEPTQVPALPDATHGLRYEESRVQDHQWAAERPKRFLAATVAVGTIDQALLSIIQTRHAHLRSVLLDRALLVVDEVHASDPYMARLLETLLQHHQAAGGWAILLSATLGSSLKRRLLPSLNVPASVAEAQTVPYPAVTNATGLPIRPATAVSNREVEFVVQPWYFQLSSIVAFVANALANKASILIILNTVRRSVATFRLLEQDLRIQPYLLRCEGQTAPHHGRFAAPDRVLLDDAIQKLFDKDVEVSPRVAVGTQTLEQSLNLDADLLITDLCPADVLLQRVGRLHRFRSRKRPAAFSTSQCVVLVPPEDLVNGLSPEGRPFSRYTQHGLGSVYSDLRILELTRRAILSQRFWVFPRENRKLVEETTHEEALAQLPDPSWIRHAQDVTGHIIADRVQAGTMITAFHKHFGTFQFNEAGGKVATRLGLDDLHLPLDKPIQSPFGETVTTMIIPGHLRPKTFEETITVELSQSHRAVLKLGDKQYQYSHVGLEVLN